MIDDKPFLAGLGHIVVEMEAAHLHAWPHGPGHGL